LLNRVQSSYIDNCSEIKAVFIKALDAAFAGEGPDVIEIPVSGNVVVETPLPALDDLTAGTTIRGWRPISYNRPFLAGLSAFRI
jgi:hypothetical protein